jgi:hypothetical protein
LRGNERILGVGEKYILFYNNLIIMINLRRGRKDEGTKTPEVLYVGVLNISCFWSTFNAY